MSILPSDVKLYESQRLIDEDDGGGRATGNVIIDGDLNNLFADISRLDRTIGDVALRKAFVGIATANADTYLGAHAILTQKPADPNVSVVLFDTGSESDERTSAQNRIESYVVRGAQANWFLLGDQYTGQRLLLAFQDVTRDLPEVGEVYELIDDDGATQFVRLTSVEAEDDTFVEEAGNTVRYLDRRKLTLGISAPLEATFTGGTPTIGGSSSPRSDVQTTEVADAARYYGVTETTAEALQGELTVSVASIFAALVPSAQSESIWLDEPGGYVRRLLLPLGNALGYSTNTSYVDGGYVIYLPTGIAPGSLTLTISGCVYTDDGLGGMIHQSGNDYYSSNKVDYASGLMTGYRSANSAGTLTYSVAWNPVAAFNGGAESGMVEVTLGNRSFSWTLNLADSKPQPGTLVISYLAQGKWQTIEDTGTGVLDGQGSGSVNFVTGSVAMTMPVMPDVGSAIVYAYIVNESNEVETHSGLIANMPQVTLQLGEAIKPGTLSLAWTSGTAKTASDNGSGGITGDAVGTIDYASGECVLAASGGGYLNVSASIIADWENDDGGNQVEAQSYNPDINGVVSGTLATVPIQPGSLVIKGTAIRKKMHTREPDRGAYLHQASYTDDLTVTRKIRDDGVGGFTYADDGAFCPGAINYTTGAYTVEIEREYSHGTVISKSSTGRVGNSMSTFYGQNTVRDQITGATNLYYQLASATNTPQNDTLASAQCVLKLTDAPSLVIPGSVYFTFGGSAYIDIDGVIHEDPSTLTGVGTAVGEIDYSSGQVTLDSWPANQATTATIVTMATPRASVAASVVKFRTPGKPLRPGSLQITAVREDTGELITATADADGTIATAELSGYVDVDSGLVDLWFTSDDSDDSGATDIPVFPGSLRYNAVSYSYLPMDADLIGVDPVRLPADGRVPIVRDGDVCVLAHTAETDVGTPVADQVETLARDHQAEILVKDSNGVELAPAQYTVDLIAGTVTFASGLVLEDSGAEALVPPLAIFDRIEHMSVISDTQISGDLAMISQLSHDYPAGSTFSTALLWGDIAARVSDEFTQKTWNSSSPNWTANRIGDDTTASFNLIDYPILVTNDGAITEKWALVFTSSSSFQVVGEQVGIIGTATTASPLEPINPNTGEPYFTLDQAGWGTGWSAGNVLRFNTEGCLAPLWLARTVLSGLGTVDDDSVTTQIRGDAD